jgi:hypothetical protein
MTKFKKLKKEALESCGWRKHKMSRFEGHISTCEICGAWVRINTNPAANEIDIGGPAVALNCPADSKWL